MDELFLSETVGDATIFVSPLADRVYRQSGVQGLGGSQGFFVCAQRNSNPAAGFEILAKASSIDNAQLIFNALVSSLRNGTIHQFA
ncbi:MAG: hypothetical protein CFE32_13795 [Alphaproteobacteria bacterium PA3]|nr:MAG: hypothetical protein CFE32_13795 [Alphaproteobacteria bacterium PA3]